MNFVRSINDREGKIPRAISGALNRFFGKHPLCAEGCIIRESYLSNPVTLIVESSILYDFLQGEYGWDVHTEFYRAFEGTGYRPEMINACVVGFYKDWRMNEKGN
jgi:hypothetical protein